MQSSVADDRLRAAAETGHTPNAHGGLSTHHTPPVTRTNEKKNQERIHKLQPLLRSRGGASNANAPLPCVQGVHHREGVVLGRQSLQQGRYGLQLATGTARGLPCWWQTSHVLGVRLRAAPRHGGAATAVVPVRGLQEARINHDTELPLAQLGPSVPPLGVPLQKQTARRGTHTNTQ